MVIENNEKEMSMKIWTENYEDGIIRVFMSLQLIEQTVIYEGLPIYGHLLTDKQRFSLITDSINKLLESVLKKRRIKK